MRTQALTTTIAPEDRVAVEFAPETNEIQIWVSEPDFGTSYSLYVPVALAGAMAQGITEALKTRTAILGGTVQP